jgi:hypothetical protein
LGSKFSPRKTDPSAEIGGLVCYIAQKLYSYSFRVLSLRNGEFVENVLRDDA